MKEYLHEVVHVDNKADFCIGVVILKHLESPPYFRFKKLKEK
jgi:methylenetetrahydrofolate reductase (NADPH)